MANVSQLARHMARVMTLRRSLGDNVPSKKLSIRMVTGVWCLMALVLVSGYTGNLIFYLTVPTMMPIVNNFEDVAARSDPRLILDAKSYFAERILVTHLTKSLSGSKQ